MEIQLLPLMEFSARGARPSVILKFNLAWSRRGHRQMTMLGMGYRKQNSSLGVILRLFSGQSKE